MTPPFDDDVTEPADRSPSARERITRAVDRLGADELEVLALIAERMVMGRAQYGELHLDSDPRDFRREALEEAADGLFYVAAALVRGQGLPRAANDGSGANRGRDEA